MWDPVTCQHVGWSSENAVARMGAKTNMRIFKCSDVRWSPHQVLMKLQATIVADNCMDSVSRLSEKPHTIVLRYSGLSLFYIALVTSCMLGACEHWLVYIEPEPNKAIKQTNCCLLCAHCVMKLLAPLPPLTDSLPTLPSQSQPAS